MLINLLHFFSCRQHIFICLLKDAVPGYLILFRFSAGHYIILCRSLDFKDKQDFSTGYQAFCYADSADRNPPPEAELYNHNFEVSQQLTIL